ncbi:protein of unknown function [Cupriavidus neocaledonicus]|uniref:Uncharacterized protein n=1 Tax=Cupriavidus neocaledonicus TaxID=1040979 RepID=A0A375H772_9BURK|nr:protein of unknown function [Cupriavidus neocaledonicus]
MLGKRLSHKPANCAECGGDEKHTR